MHSGPYAIVRHPIYTGFRLALFGAALWMGEIRALLAVAVVLIGMRMKINLEESLLREQFGEAYARYQSEVKSMITFAW